MSTVRQVTTTRLGRMAQLGQLVGGIAGGAVSEGAKRLARGQRPSVGDLLLTSSNMEKLTTRLSEMRGAAMKVGQLLSMDSGQLLPPQLSEVLARLREDAHQMPLGQVAQVLKQAWGDGWESNFKRFFFTPIAAASIGQVHEALLQDGQRLAIKVQYPGIRRSIDSDVDNVAALLSLFRLLPEELDFDPLLQEAKQQLQVETDYCQEAAALGRYQGHLVDDDRFLLPQVIESLSTSEVLAMTYLDGEPIEALEEQPAIKRNAAASTLLELAMREVFDWGLVQTDPNFANYQYLPGSGKLALLDFGATRTYSEARQAALLNLLRAITGGDDGDITQSAVQVGYLGESDPGEYREFVLRLLHMVGEPLTARQSYDFARTDLASRMSDTLIELRLRSRYGRIPPPDILFLHRKLGGMFLLLSRLQAKIDARELIRPYL